MTAQHMGATKVYVYPKAFGIWTIVTISAVLLLLGLSGNRLDIQRFFVPSSDGSLGIIDLGARFFPPQLGQRQLVSNIPDFNAARLPLFAHLENEVLVEDRIDPKSLAVVRTQTTQVILVEPIGHVAQVTVKIGETFEIAIWGTVLALLMGLPLALMGARAAFSNSLLGGVFRAITGMLRALPELISALLLVTIYGFGPLAGVLALGIHGAGFLGKFFAEEIENADKRPQEALIAIGTNRFAVWRLAILPQVLPAYIGYTFYILDRNVRMATVIGLVGAGGIGQELKGRFDMYEYPRVGTILIAIFIVVILLDIASARLRRKLA